MSCDCRPDLPRRGLALTLALLLAATTRAAPHGGVVVAGDAEINVDDALTEILQDGDRLAIDWDGFDIAAGETVRFVQPSADAIALNRIVGGDATRIFGSLEANGRVALINTRGILFADTATVDVAALIASGLDVDPEDVTEAEWRLAAVPGDAGFVVNGGMIEAAVGATLVGRQVTNEAGALIAADVVQLIGADAAVLTFDDAGLVGVAVDAAVADGTAMAAVINAGELTGGRILLEAEVAGDVFANAVNHTGMVRAQGFDTSGGQIRLVGTGGDVITSGDLDASSATLAGGVIEVTGETTFISGNLDAGGVTGGEITLGGGRVALQGGVTVDASGRDGGGSIRVGERISGSATEAVYIGADALLSTSATQSGGGGDVVIEADGSVRFFGAIEARGGGAGGDGGRVETSAGAALIAAGRIDTRAPAGAAGEYLLDSPVAEVGAGAGAGDDADPFPAGVTDTLLDAAALGVNLAAGNVTVTAAGAIIVTDDIDLDGSGGNTLSLLAGGDVDIDDGVTIADANIGTADATTLILRADADVSLGAGSRIASGGGNVSLDGVDADNFGVVDAGTGAIALTTGRGGVDSDSSLGTLTSTTGIDITGGAGDDVYRLTGVIGAGPATLNGGAGGNRLTTGVPDQTFTLGAAAGQFSLPGITFSNLQQVDAAGVANVLFGNGLERIFTAPAPGQVSANGVSFDGVGEVLGSGSDELAASAGAFTLTGSDGELRHRGLLFRGLGSAAAGGGALTGTAADDVFTATGTPGALEVAAIAFSGLELVTGGGGTDHLAAAGVVALTGADGAVSHRDMLFQGLSTVATGVGGVLAGSAGDDMFTAVGNPGELSASAIDFSGLAVVAGGGGNDRLAGAGAFALTGADGEVSHQGMLFQDIGSVAAGAGTLTGTGADDELVSAGSPGALRAAEVDFTDLGLLLGGGGDDRLTASAGGFSLTGTDGEVSHLGVLFRGLGRVAAGGGSLAGTATDDVFTANGNADEIVAAAIGFTGLGVVTGGGGSDSLGVTAAGEVIGLSATGGVLYRGVDVREVTTVEANDGTLLGSAAADTFTLGGGRLLADGLSFGGLAEVRGDGAGSGDALVLGAGDDTFALAGTDGFDHAGIRFRTLERVAAGGGANRLVGTGGNDTFRIVGTGAVSALEIRFDDIGTVAAGQGVDHVLGGGSDGVFEAPAPNRIASSGVVFQDVEHVDAGTATDDLLLGTAGDDGFALVGSRSLTFAGILFGNLDRADGAGGVNTVLGTAAPDLVAVSGSRSLIVAGLSFTGIDVVTGNGGGDLLLGGGADDVFVLAAVPGELRHRDVLFQNWHQVDGGAGRNTVTGRAAADDWRLTGIRNVEAHAVGFANIDAVAGGGGADRVIGPNAGSDFLLDGDARVVSGTITFDGMSGGIAGGAGDDVFRIAPGFSAGYLVDGGAGSNRLAGHTGDDTFTLTGDDARVGYGLAEFTGIRSVEGGAGVNTLQGTPLADTATLIGSRSLTADGITFASLSQVSLGAGTDQLTAAAGGSNFTVTAADAASVAGMTFDGVERLQGGAADDTFTLQAGARVSAGIGGGAGRDLLAAEGDALDWHVTAGGNRVGATAFDGIETVTDFSTTEVSLTSDLALTFNEGSWIGFSGGDVVRFEYRPIDAMTVSGAELIVDSLPFAGGTLVLESSGAVTGSGLAAAQVDIDAAGDVRLSTDVDSISAAAGGDIDISQVADIELLRLVTRGGAVTVQTEGDQVVTSIDAGAGSVTLRSALGRLLVDAAAARTVQISAGQIDLDALLAIGTVEHPFFLESSSAPRISALEYVSPILAPGTPQPLAQGRRIASLAEAVAASGLRSAVQPYAIDLVLIDPAIFTALLPFSIGSEAVALPQGEPR